MFANITVRWLLIYFCMGWAASPLIWQRPVGLEHIGFALLALYLIYFAPKPTVEK